MRAALAATVLALLAGPSLAHDSWFAPLPRTDRGEAVFAFGTGNQFPVMEVTIPLSQLASSGCRGEGQGGSQRAASLRWVADRPVALVLRSARPVPATAALTCWAQLHPIDIEIADNAIVEIYLKEVNALPAVRERWEAMRARGVRWQENYTKHARIELGAMDAGAAASAPADLAAPVAGLGLDLRLENPGLLRAGDTLRAQLLRDGQPLAGLPLELRSDLSPVGIWRQTDAEGRISVTVPLAARWLLRGVDLRASERRADAWDSRFITLAFEVLPKR